MLTQLSFEPGPNLHIICATLPDHVQTSTSRVFDLFQLSIETYNNFLCVTVKAVNDPVEFFTDRIRAAFRDPEPNDYQLIRLFVARSEVILHSLICSV